LDEVSHFKESQDREFLTDIAHQPLIAKDGPESEPLSVSEVKIDGVLAD